MQRLAALVLFGALLSCGATNDRASPVDLSSDYEGDEAGECSDAADNDRDGAFDCDDSGCSGSPDCQGADTDTDTDTDADSDSDTDTDGSSVLCPGHVLCDVSGMALTYTLAFDFWVDSPFTQDCLLSFSGDGVQLEVGADNRLTLFGEWKGVATTCTQDITENTLWLDWQTWEAHHSFFFDDDATVLQHWFAHGDPSGFETVPQGQSTLAAERFYITDLHQDFDFTDPVVSWELEEDVPDAFLTLFHDLDITFTVAD